MKTKYWLSVIQSVLKDILVSVQCATKTVPKAIPTSLLSAISHRDMVEALDHTRNARTVRSGDSCGTQNARKDTMLSHAACANPNAQKAWQTWD